MSELTATAAADMAVIMAAQDTTATIGGQSGVPCAFVNTGSLGMELFMEQDEESAKMLVNIADLDDIPEPETLCTAPDGGEYRIKTVQPDGHGVTVLLTLEDPTGQT
jgi:hypothetical protein